jgi:DNA-binding transcriptional MerR regulator
MFIKWAKLLSFSLNEIRELLSLRAFPEAGCAEVRAQAKSKIKAIDDKMASLTAMRHARGATVSRRNASQAAPNQGAWRPRSFIELGISQRLHAVLM